MRDLIMERLNTAIAQAGSQLGFQAAIELEGLPTLSDVERRRTTWKAASAESATSQDSP